MAVMGTLQRAGYWPNSILPPPADNNLSNHISMARPTSSSTAATEDLPDYASLQRYDSFATLMENESDTQSTSGLTIAPRLAPAETAVLPIRTIGAASDLCVVDGESHKQLYRLSVPILPLAGPSIILTRSHGTESGIPGSPRLGSHTSEGMLDPSSANSSHANKTKSLVGAGKLGFWGYSYKFGLGDYHDKNAFIWRELQRGNKLDEKEYFFAVPIEGRESGPAQSSGLAEFVWKMTTPSPSQIAQKPINTAETSDDIPRSRELIDLSTGAVIATYHHHSLFHRDIGQLVLRGNWDVNLSSWSGSEISGSATPTQSRPTTPTPASPGAQTSAASEESTATASSHRRRRSSAFVVLPPPPGADVQLLDATILTLLLLIHSWRV
jgi:hypothetical protein